MVPEAKPWRSAFFEEMALPDSVFGPVDFEVDGCGAINVFSPASVQQEEIEVGVVGELSYSGDCAKYFLGLCDSEGYVSNCSNSWLLAAYGDLSRLALEVTYRQRHRADQSLTADWAHWHFASSV